MKKALPVLSICALLFAPGVSSAQEVINFNAFNAGDTLENVFSTPGNVGPVVVDGVRPGSSDNEATAFDSSNPTCDDFDLGTPNETCDMAGPGVGAGGEMGMIGTENCQDLDIVAIIQEGPEGADQPCAPDDADLVGAELSFDFSAVGTVTMNSLKVLDIENAEVKGAVVNLYGPVPDAALLATFPLPEVGDNGLATVFLGPTAGVEVMVVKLNGSGAIDDIEFEEERGSDGCTPGYWRQLHHFDSWMGAAPADDFNTTFMVDVEWGRKCRADSNGDITLGQGVRCRGGGKNALARHGVAALLNANQTDVAFGLTASEVKAIVKAGLDAGTKAAATAAKNLLATENELGCPLN
jgi:hypothetical protein